jgi:hypothetical protein
MEMWPGSNPVSDRLDRTIDEVARQMTDGTPSADLKRRVRARIAEHDARSRPRRLAWLAAPVAAAAAIVLAVFLWSLQPTERGVGTVTRTPSVARTPDVPLPPDRPLSSTPLPETVRATGQTQASADGTTTARGTAPSPRPLRAPSDIERMAPPSLEVASIAVPSLTISDITTPSIAVEPLKTIAPIALSPIGEGDRQ